MSQFLTDLSASIAAGDVRVVSDEQHRRNWNARHWQQQQRDLRAAQGFALNYSTEQLLDLIELHERSPRSASARIQTMRDDVKRQYMMALEIKRRPRVEKLLADRGGE